MQVNSLNYRRLDLILTIFHLLVKNILITLYSYLYINCYKLFSDAEIAEDILKDFVRGDFATGDFT